MGLSIVDVMSVEEVRGQISARSATVQVHDSADVEVSVSIGLKSTAALSLRQDHKRH